MLLGNNNSLLNGLFYNLDCWLFNIFNLRLFYIFNLWLLNIFNLRLFNILDFRFYRLLSLQYSFVSFVNFETSSELRMLLLQSSVVNSVKYSIPFRLQIP